MDNRADDDLLNLQDVYGGGGDMTRLLPPQKMSSMASASSLMKNGFVWVGLSAVAGLVVAVGYAIARLSGAAPEDEEHQRNVVIQAIIIFLAVALVGVGASKFLVGWAFAM